MSRGNYSVADAAFARALDELHSLALADPLDAPPLSLDPFSVPVDLANGQAVVTSEINVVSRTEPRSRILSLTDAPTLRSASKLLQLRKVSSRDLVENSLNAMFNSVGLGAVVSIDEDAALRAADLFDSERAMGIVRGPLHGIPITVKDIIDVASFPTDAGSKAYHEYPQLDAVGVERLRAAGALILAKVATHEFALGVTTPQCRNPFDPQRISGGSSGGSAIAVATGIGLASLGTDTRASLRVPSALCGVVGFKPSFDLVPTGGIVPLSWTIDHVGPITRTVADAAVMLNVLAGKEFLNANPPKVNLERITVGVVTAAFGDADIEISSVIESIFPALRMLGAKLVEIDTPSSVDFDLANSLGLLISRSEAATVHRSLGTDLDLCIPEVRDQLRAALKITAADYLDAQRHRKVLARKTLRAFESCDVLLMPTVPVLTPLWTDYEKHLLHLSRNAILWSLLGAPAVSLPAGTSSDGMPVGLQLVAAPGRDGLLLGVGIELETVLRE